MTSNKLLDKLDKLGQSQKIALGLSSAAAPERVPPILMVGVVKEIKDGHAQFYDALLVNQPGGAKKGEAKNGASAPAWGCLSSFNGKHATGKQLKEAGADFVLVSALESPADVLSVEDLAYGFMLQQPQPRERNKAIHALGFDFLVLELKGDVNRLTVKDILGLGEVLSAFSAHVFLQIESLPKLPMLELFQELPVSGLVIDDSQHGREELANLREVILVLKPRDDRLAVKLPA